MQPTHLSEQAVAYLRKLCLEIPGRQVGSAGNGQATTFFASVAASFGFEIETPVFECMDWTSEGVQLSAESGSFTAFASPYSLGCDVSAPLVIASSMDELAQLDAGGKILLLRGEIASQQLMPKNFPFYNPDEHKRIITLLESQQPCAIVAATTRDPMMAGSLYPFPLFEDGDFDIPSVFMTAEEGDLIAQHADESIRLASRAERVPATGCSVIARKAGSSDSRIVLFAHIDAKLGSPGAIDNGSGVVTLLLLAELLADYTGKYGIEIVALNGEDYYSNPGEQQYLALNMTSFDSIALGINLDGVGYRKGNTAFSLYECPDWIADVIRDVASCRAGIVKGEPWYQGDHMLFVLGQRPALAFTSEHVVELLTDVIHTSNDCPEVVDPVKLADLAVALHDLLLRLD